MAGMQRVVELPLRFEGSAAPYLRMSAVGAAAPVGSARRRPLQATSDAESSAPRILLLEPDATVAAMLRAALTRAGFDVLVATTTEEAHHLMAEPQPLPALVIAESELKGRDGFSFCEQLRSDLRTTHLPVLLIAPSIEAAQAQAQLANDVGADDLLPKPLYLQDVIALARLKTQPGSVDGRFEAHTSSLPLPQLTRALLTGMRSGQILFEQSGGRITFRGGRIIEASYEGMRGLVAARRLLALAEGAYAVVYGPAPGRGSLDIDLRALCVELLPEAARFRQALSVGVPLDARLAVELKEAARQVGGFPIEIERLMRLFDGRRTVLNAVLESGLPEATALAATTRLYGMGVLVPLQPLSEEPLPGEVIPALRKAPRLFEPAVLAQKPLPPELVRQLDAFQIRTVSELPVEPVDPIALNELAQAPATHILNRATAQVVEVSSPAVTESKFEVRAEDPESTQPGVAVVGAPRSRVKWLLLSGALVLAAVGVLVAR